MLAKIKNFFKVDFHPDRIYGFDIIRALAVASVLYGHGGHIIPGEIGSFYTASYEFLDGVFVFFILSGFLIGQLLIYTIENKPITKETLVQFWKKRLLRTVPAYYFTLILLIIISLITIKGFGNFKTLLYFFNLQNFCTSHPFFFGEAWTLSIEVWFYILVPLVVFIFKGYFKLSDKKSILFSVIIFLLVGFITRLVRCYTLEQIDGVTIDYMFRKQVITRIDSVTFGIIGSFVFRYFNDVWYKYKYLCLILGMLIFLYTKFPLFEETRLYRLVFFYSLQSLSFLLILPYFSTIKTGSGILYKTISTLSYTSFSVYLLNFTLIQFYILDNINFDYFFGNYGVPIKYFLYIFLSLVGGIYMYKKIELPFMQLRNKIG